VRIIRLWGILSAVLVSLMVALLVGFIIFKALPEFRLELFFGGTPVFDAVFKGERVWDGLWTPLLGTLKLLALCGMMAVPMGISLGIYIAQYAGEKARDRLLVLMEALSGIPSIIMGLFGFVLVLFLKKIFPSVGTGMLLSAFCLSLLILPVLSLATYNALSGLPSSIAINASSLGLSKQATLISLLLPAARQGILSGVLLAAGRCAEDTAVILMTGAVAMGTGGITEKFEALPFFIYYTSANYQSEAQLAQVFVAAAMLLALTFVLVMGAGFHVRKSGSKE
jgi:phosphate transport system permease protein